MIEKIEWEGKVLALVLRASYNPDGVDFITSGDNPLQLGVMGHRQGVRIKPHVHKNFPRTVNEVQEVLHIDRGEVEAEFYDKEGKEVVKVRLNSGDTILLLSGGHGFNVLRDSRIIEVKQGPYTGVTGDKQFFSSQPQQMESTSK